MAEVHDPKAFGDVLAYLDAVGFDHLYLRREDIRPGPVDETAARVVEAVPPPRPAASRPPAPRSPASQPAAPRQARPSSPMARSGPEPRPTEAPPVGAEPRVDEPASPVSLDDLAGLPEDPAERFHLLEAVRQRALSCTACGLARGRQQVVFADGHPGADLMLVGEGPGAEEDRQGLPFVGPAGRLLNKILGAIDEDRRQVYICNTVKCRPPRNRDPKADEVAACRPYLDRQIDLVQPKVILALGRVGAQALLGTNSSLGRLRGRWHEVRGVPTWVTYHPAALLRNDSLKRPTWDDVRVVRDRLAELRG